MTANEVLHVLQAEDIRLTVEGDQLCYDAPAEAITDEVLTLMRQHKPGLRALLRQALASATPSVAPAAPSAHGAALTTPAVGWRCRCCQGTRRWRSRDGVLICGRCHPPADAALVAGWDSEDCTPVLTRTPVPTGTRH
jgi:tubulysin polyketide synthase-like protein